MRPLVLALVLVAAAASGQEKPTPAAPPAPDRESLPMPPVNWLALPSPVSVSLKAEPVRFSIPASVSVPSPVAEFEVSEALIAAAAAE